MSSLPFQLDPNDPFFLEWSQEVRHQGFPLTALFGFYRICYNDVAAAARHKEFWEDLEGAGVINVAITGQSLFNVTLKNLRGDFPADIAERNYDLVTRMHTPESLVVENHFFNRMLQKLLELKKQQLQSPVLVES